ncbi:hypothetical protein HETIRDRAFT_163186 [Heterobasidion irregulare TC 32-1]|uniref:Uncharacterized protein n=1 Tax=Heterobasidion irregulare (strain TC 32-1) TaxID=747525 RepID=W4KAA4_HETIT|nr:uncharacterized protein HETIRDRAFT_163186 [Heterobasidion irregulare TC 32-1]ETW82762.1 hypothetical protein HETIRDRAFT_163186 [Heterobasidion irregulare TC 32-1]
MSPEVRLNDLTATSGQIVDHLSGSASSIILTRPSRPQSAKAVRSVPSSLSSHLRRLTYSI